MRLGNQIAMHAHGALDETRICYWKTSGGTWVIYLPGCGIGELRNHRVTEHEDGTISVAPSIRMVGHDNGAPSEAHGFLVRGEWRDA